MLVEWTAVLAPAGDQEVVVLESVAVEAPTAVVAVIEIYSFRSLIMTQSLSLPYISSFNALIIAPTLFSKLKINYILQNFNLNLYYEHSILCKKSLK